MRSLVKIISVLQAFGTCPGMAQASVPQDQANVRAIYARLCSAAGVEHSAPILEFDEKSTRSAGAFTDFEHLPTRIVVERKALDICATFGDRAGDAVAFLLGHELAHFSMGHGWGADLQHIGDHSRVKADMALAFANNQAYHLFETQADQRGAFYAYIAGYSPELVADTLLQRLYAGYGWSAKMSGYPDRPDREALLRSGLQRYQAMTMALRLADQRLIMGQYREAASMYDLLLSEGYRNPMLFTNAGVCHLLQAIALSPPEGAVFTYPVEIDLREKWRGAAGGMGRPELLDKAEDCFLQALLMDRGSWSAMADMACTAFLRDDLAGAAYWIEQLGRSRVSNGRTRTILQAILEARRGDVTRAKAILKDPVLKDSWIARRNLEAIEGRAAVPQGERTEANAASVEELDGRSLSELATGFADAQKLDHRGNTILYYHMAPGLWKMSADRTDAAGRTHWLYLGGTRAGYNGESARGIRLRDTMDRLSKAYGPADRTLQTLDGEVVLYEREGILFRLDHDQRVAGWTLMTEKQL